MRVARNEIVYDILASEADEAYYVGDAEIPALLILRPHHPFNRSKKWVLWFFTLGRFYGTEKEVRKRLRKGIMSATKPIQVYKVEKYARKRKLRGFKQLFFDGYTFQGGK